MSSSSTAPDLKDNVVTDVYNGRLDSDEYGFIFARSVSRKTGFLPLKEGTLTYSGQLAQTLLSSTFGPLPQMK